MPAPTARHLERTAPASTRTVQARCHVSDRGRGVLDRDAPDGDASPSEGTLGRCRRDPGGRSRREVDASLTRLRAGVGDRQLRVLRCLDAARDCRASGRARRRRALHCVELEDGRSTCRGRDVDDGRVRGSATSPRRRRPPKVEISAGPTSHVGCGRSRGNRSELGPRGRRHRRQLGVDANSASGVDGATYREPEWTSIAPRGSQDRQRPLTASDGRCTEVAAFGRRSDDAVTLAAGAGRRRRPGRTRSVRPWTSVDRCPPGRRSPRPGTRARTPGVTSVFRSVSRKPAGCQP